MKRKHIHRVIINQSKDHYTHRYTYRFGQTDGIEIALSYASARITVEISRTYDTHEVIMPDNHLFSDAIKKAMYLHLLLYSKNLEINTMTVQIDCESDVVVDQEQSRPSPIFSMVEKVHHPIAKKWSEEEISGFLKIKKSHNDPRLAALTAFLISKSKLYETERFLFLWTAFNGMYNFVSTNIFQNAKAGEQDKILYVQKLYGLGNEMVKDLKHYKTKTKLANEVKSILFKTYYQNDPMTKDSLESGGRYFALNEAIRQRLYNENTKKAYDVTPYGYLLTQFSYFFRCNLFHGEKPYALFSFAEEREIKCLACINALLDEFIEKELPRLFDEAAVARLKQRAEETSTGGCNQRAS